MIEVIKSDGNQFFPTYLNGVLKRYSLGSDRGKRVITLEIITEEDWKVTDKTNIADLMVNKEGSKDFVDNFLRMIDL